MDALNFLYEKPTVTWLDFYINPEKLGQKIKEDSRSTNNNNGEPSIENLIAQFCDQVKYEETFIVQENLPFDELEYHKSKRTKLWVMVLKICAYLKWNLETLRKNSTVVNLKRIVEELCALTWDTNSLAYVLTSTQNFAELTPGHKFVAIFTARWVLDSLIFNNFPQPPPKIIVSNPFAQIDPSQVLAEAKNYCLATLKCVCDLAVKLLEHVLTLPLTEYCSFLPECFEIPVEGHGDIYLNWQAFEEEKLETAIMQIKYDLGVYYFFTADYKKAKAYFTDCLPLLRHSTEELDNGHWSFSVQSLKGYCSALNISASVDDVIIKPEVTFNDALPELSPVQSSLPSIIQAEKLIVDKSALQTLEGPGQILNTFDPSELKQLIFSGQMRYPVRYTVPAAVQHALGRLPSGNAQDLIALYLCKANQMSMLDNPQQASILLNAAVQEFRTYIGFPVPEVPLELTNEHIRLELIRWHDALHRCPDMPRMTAFTQELALKVKQFVADSQRQNTPPPSIEMSLLSAAFLLNTCDWEYIILSTKMFRSRYMDFAKFLAGLCYKVSRGSSSIQLQAVAREFFDVILPIAIDARNNQNPILLSRQQFTSVVKLIKEQMAVGMLLSFFGELHNCKHGGLMEMFIDSANLWPGISYTDANHVNDAFLREVLTIILDNGLLVNPNNAFLLRTIGDLRLSTEDYRTAMQYYLQSIAACSDYFSKPLPNNVVDDKLINNMIKCCAKLECHTAEALLHQFLDQPNYHAALKALQEVTGNDGIESFYQFIWDVNILECLIANTDHNDPMNKCRLDEAMRVISQPEMNLHNPPHILRNVERKRTAEFLCALCSLFL